MICVQPSSQIQSSRSRDNRLYVAPCFGLLIGRICSAVFWPKLTALAARCASRPTWMFRIVSRGLPQRRLSVPPGQSLVFVLRCESADRFGDLKLHMQCSRHGAQDMWEWRLHVCHSRDGSQWGFGRAIRTTKQHGCAGQARASRGKACERPFRRPLATLASTISVSGQG